MALSLSRITAQIEKLQKQASALQAGVVERIKKEIRQHGLTVEHLFGTSNEKAAATSKPKTKAVAKSASKPPKFADANGNTWGGMGKRPEWIRTALDAGHSLDEFLIDKKPARATKKTASSKAPGTAINKMAEVAKTKAAAPKSGAKPKTAKRAKVAKKVGPTKSSPAAKQASTKSGASARPVDKSPVKSVAAKQSK